MNCIGMTVLFSGSHNIATIRLRSNANICKSIIDLCQSTISKKRKENVEAIFINVPFNHDKKTRIGIDMKKEMDRKCPY